LNLAPLLVALFAVIGLRSQPVEIAPAEQRSDVVEVSIARCPPEATIREPPRDAGNCAPIAASVLGFHLVDESGRTFPLVEASDGAAGSFRIDGLTAGTYRVAIGTDSFVQLIQFETWIQSGGAMAEPAGTGPFIYDPAVSLRIEIYVFVDAEE
jgi:hypothetical protein